MTFHEVRFPASLSFGAAGGPERRTEIVTLANGFEERNSPWEHSRRRYDAGLGLRALDDVETALAFFEARRGQLYGFRWKDWADYRSSRPSEPITDDDQILGTGDGAETAFQLTKTYSSGGFDYVRPIAKPVAGTVVVALDGAPQAEGTAFSLDAETGIVTFATAPAAGVQITAGFEFDVPVRFDTDTLTATADAFAAGQVPSIPVVEVRV